MTNKRAYQQTLLERECYRHKVACDHNCINCDYYNPIVMEDYFRYLIDILKARDPMLYLVSELDELKEVLNNNESKNS